jgi:hypothetical protein
VRPWKLYGSSVVTMLVTGVGPCDAGFHLLPEDTEDIAMSCDRITVDNAHMNTTWNFLRVEAERLRRGEDLINECISQPLVEGLVVSIYLINECI